MARILSLTLRFPQQRYSQNELAKSVVSICRNLYPQFNHTHRDTINDVFKNSMIESRPLLFAPCPVGGMHKIIPSSALLLPHDNENVQHNKHISAESKYISETISSMMSEAISIALKDGGKLNLYDHVRAMYSHTGWMVVPTVCMRARHKLQAHPDMFWSAQAGLGCGSGTALLRIAKMHVTAQPNDIVVSTYADTFSRFFTGPLMQKFRETLTYKNNDAADAAAADGSFNRKEWLHWVIMSCIFSDLAAAMVTVHHKHPLATTVTKHKWPMIIDGASRTAPNSIHVVGQDLAYEGYYPYIGEELKTHVIPTAQSLIHDLLKKHGLRTEHIKHWIVHPGGRKILETFEQHQVFTREQLKFSWQSIREVGNVGGGSVWHVLQKTVEAEQSNGGIEPGTYGVMIGAGSGVTVYAALLRW